MSSNGRRSYDTAASAQVQGELAGVVAALESVIGERSRTVAHAMSDFQADGVSDRYAGVEGQWNHAAQEVRAIIALVKTTLVRNDDAADQALSRARGAVAGIS